VQHYVSTDLGVDPNAFFLFDGAGSDDRDRSAGTAFTTFLRAVDAEPYAAALEDAMPILGVDGDLANQGLGTPAVGHVHSKTGTRAGVEPAGIGLANARTQIRYIDAASGRELVFSIMVADVPWDRTSLTPDPDHHRRRQPLGCDLRGLLTAGVRTRPHATSWGTT